MEWIRDEHEYADNKPTQREEEDDAHTLEEGYSYWEPQIGMYVHRAFTLGAANPAGRQAALKAAMTAISFAESVVRIFGPVPEPGVSSGYNLDNLRPIRSKG